MSIEIMKQALEALEAPWNTPYIDGCDLTLGKKIKAITSLRQAIAEAEQDKFCDNNCVWTNHDKNCVRSNNKEPIAFIDERGELKRYAPSNFNECEFGGLTRLYTKEQL